MIKRKIISPDISRIMGFIRAFALAFIFCLKFLLFPINGTGCIILPFVENDL